MSETDDQDIDEFFSAARVSGQEGAIELPTDSYLNFLYDREDPKIAGARGMTYLEFAEDRYQAPFLQDLLRFWESLYREPFAGVTNDGVVRTGLYRLPDEVPTDPEPAGSAMRALAVLDGEEREQFCYPINASEWRAWSNPEFVVHRVGLRLEDLSRDKSDAIVALVRASLSPEGYAQVREAMLLNAYLGDLVGLPNIMNEGSYWASLFGVPSGAEPWGWQLFGHHVAVNFVSVAGRHVIAPVFLGAEPALTDAHPPLFDTREKAALELASSLTHEQRARAIVYDSVLDPAMPEGRLHPADERHVAGAFRDNRVIPYEGIPATSLTDRQRSLLRSVIEDFLVLLVQPQREATLRDVDAHLEETWFSWYGATDGTQPFYFRIQSPVVIAELDNHAGVWLNNRLPARFHVHTTLRLPNGNDYGRAYIDQWRARLLENEDTHA
jgi:hypothetical protein